MPLAGTPLLGRTIETAKASGVCGRIMVSTESDEVAEVALKYGAEVPFMRPKHLAHDPFGVSDVCLNVLETYEEQGVFFDKLFILLPTSPFCLPEDIVKACTVFHEEDADFLFSVVEMGHVFNALEFTGNGTEVRPRFPDMATRKRHETPELYRANGAICIMSVVQFKKQKTYYGTPLHAYPMPWERSIDIDTEADFAMAEFLIERSKFDVR